MAQDKLVSLSKTGRQKEQLIEKQEARLEKKPVSELEKKPVGELEKRPVERLEKKPAGELEKRPVEKLEKKPAGELEKRPVEKLEKKQVGELEKKQVERLEKKPAGELEKKPVESFEKKLVEKLHKNLAGKFSLPISYQNLHITNFDVLHIEGFKLTGRINDHVQVQLSAVIPEGTGEEILARTSVGSSIGVYYARDIEDEKIFLFRGVVSEIRSATKNSVPYLYITAMSNTYHLDVNKQSQSFQNTSTTYKSMLDTVLKQNLGASAVYMSDVSKAIGEICIQYKETAWEYLKRMASRFYTGLYPNMTSPKAELYFGCPKIPGGKISVIDYNCYKDIKQYEQNVNSIPGIFEVDYITYEVTSYELRRLGEEVDFQGKKLYIKEVEYRMKDSILIGKYKLCSKNGLKVKKYHNKELKGISLNGICMGVVRDKVKVQLQIDVEDRSGYLFPYSTISASPDGSGWYCMPEVGDMLRIYFPDEKEKNCFAISSISAYVPENKQSFGSTTSSVTRSASGQGGSAPTVDRMGDPNVRYIRTKDNKEITLTPEGITINADDGQAIIALDNEGNILINGAKSIQMKASNDVNIIAAKNIHMYATKDLKIQGKGGSVELLEDGTTKLTGQYVVEN